MTPESAAAAPVDADQWLSVHAAEVIGAGRASAVNLVRAAGLIPRVARYGRGPVDPVDFHDGRISLYIGVDGTVRAAESG